MKEGHRTRGDGGLSKIDRSLRALSDKDRRYLLYYLDEHEVANSEELARHIVAKESDRSPSTVPDEEYEPIQTQLQHKHLPKLADFGLVEYDERSEDVRFSNPPQGFVLLLHFCELMENGS